MQMLGLILVSLERICCDINFHFIKTGRDIDVNEARWLLHCLIIFANEVGQPRGQALDDSTVCFIYVYANAHETIHTFR